MTDFDPSEDRIDLTLLEPSAASLNEPPLRFIREGPFTGQAGELRFQQMQPASLVNGLVQGDFDGDGKPDFETILLGVSTLSGDVFNL